jgi:DNA-damage-inducible protein D
METTTKNQIAVFEQYAIRSTAHNGETYFSIVDIIGILSDSPNPSNYWNMLKRREPQLYTICVKLKFLAPDGKMRPTDCANTEGVLRIIQSVPSPKAEPFKMWMANLGKEAIAEAHDPELLTEKQAELYRAKGYSEEWIKNRLQTISIRKELTDEWQKRGVKEGQEYAILTSTVAKGTFGLTPTEHAELKGLKGQNLRDHMTPLELIFTALGEEITRSKTVKEDVQGFEEARDVAERGGQLAGDARRLVEQRENESVVSAKNYLGLNTGETEKIE